MAAEGRSSAAERLVCLRLEGKVHIFGFSSGDSNIGGLSAIVLMPCGNCVLPRRQIRQLELARALAYIVVISLKHDEITVHPGMDVALYGNKFFFLVFLHNRRGAGGLRLVPLLVHFCQGMNVV